MELIEKKLKGIYEVLFTPFKDHRGYMWRTIDRRMFEERGLKVDWVQESRSLTYKAGTVRGLHIHMPPFVEGKIIESVRGAMLWVMVDLRRNSPTFGQHETVELDGEKVSSLYISPGFANGCVSLTDDVELIIKANQYFSEENSSGINWNDPDLAVDWRLDPGKTPIMSDAHKNLMSFAEFKEKIGGLDV